MAALYVMVFASTRLLPCPGDVAQRAKRVAVALATAGAELHDLLRNNTLHARGSNDEPEGQAMGLNANGNIDLDEGRMSVEGLRVLAAGARWRYGRGSSRAALLSWLRCQREQDEPAGVAHALGEVWAKASDGPSLAAVSDAHLQEWGVEAADVRAEVLARIHRRCHVPVHIDRTDVECNGGLGSADGGREAMRLLSELLPVLAPGLIELNCSSCKLGDEGVLALAEVVPQLTHLRHIDVMDNAFTGAGAPGLRRAWQAARMAFTSAWAVGSLWRATLLPALATTLLFFTTTAPKGSPLRSSRAVRRISAMARAIKLEWLGAGLMAGGAGVASLLHAPPARGCLPPSPP
jgi:hypothetical protein